MVRCPALVSPYLTRITRLQPIATFCGSRFFPRHKRVVWLSLRLAAASREETILVKIESPTEENHILTGVM